MWLKNEKLSPLFDAISKGDRQAKKEIFTHLYNELHAMAHKAICNEYSNQILQTTALVHETYLSLLKNEKALWKNQTHFYRVAARAMRYILIDDARKRKRSKRNNGHQTVSMDHTLIEDLAAPASIESLEELDTALEKLAKQYRRCCSVVEFRFFADLTIEETARVMGLSEATVKRDWEFAKKWLRQEMNITI